MRILLGTNVLCRLAQRGHPQHLVSESSLFKLRDNGHELCLVPQVLYEYWVVATRPTEQNGLNMSSANVDTAMNCLIDMFSLLLDERGVFPIWRELVRQYGVKGKNSHDARLVAAMKRHGLQHLLTFNPDDFRRYEGIEILEPNSVMAT